MLSWICFCKFNVKDDFIIILVYICATKNLNHSIMASRKELKKQINDLTGQLALEILFRGTVMQVLEPEKMYALLSKVMIMNRQFISRVNASKRIKSSKEVKDFYQQFFTDWEKNVGEIIQEF
jgi:hypothetical protein